MSSLKTTSGASLATEVLQAFDNLNGPQPGYRPAHAKGILVIGRFTPAESAPALSRAPHLARSATPVTVRFSDFAGIPAVPDNDPNASPRGLAVRFHLAEHVHTDIIAHSVDGFPVRTAEEFVEFLRAVYASVHSTEKPSAIEKFLGSHPAALAFVQTPKPWPSSFFKESYYSVSAYRFVNREGTSRFGRYRIRPDGAGEYLDDATAAKRAPDYLFEDIKTRLARGSVKMRIAVQIAAGEDVVDDSTAHWPADRPEMDFGTLELCSILQNNDSEQQHIIFDPIPRVDGIESSGDPLLEPRADVYLASGRRRRTQ